MTNKDRIIELISEDPFISQQAISKQIGLSRSTVANIISQLVKEGRIKGRAYVLNEPNQIYCLGAANIDRKFYVKEKLIPETSNPITSENSVGGVARNIAENLGRMDLPVSLISLSGTDNDWDLIHRKTSPHVNLDLSFQKADWRTGSYTAVIDQTGNMSYGFADMEVYDQMTVEMLEGLSHRLSEARCLVVDLNLPKNCINYLENLSTAKGIPFVLVAVSGPKMARMPDRLDGVSWLITNKEESLAYFNDMSPDNSLSQLAKKWVSAGVDHVILTDGSKQVYYADKNQSKTYPVDPSTNVKDVTGAGDSFAAALLYGWLKEFTIDQSVQLAMINSKATIETSQTVRTDLTKETLLKELKTY